MYIDDKICDDATLKSLFIEFKLSNFPQSQSSRQFYTLHRMSEKKELAESKESIDAFCQPWEEPKETAKDNEPLVVWLKDCTMKNVSSVGGKNASLGEMIKELTPLGVNVPLGFATTAHAFRLYMAETHLDYTISSLLDKLNVSDVKQLRHVGNQCRAAILSHPLPATLQASIHTFYTRLCADNKHECHVAVRSSATAEDLPTASFAGQQETYLNISGSSNVIDSCHKCFASLYTDRAISYRSEMGFGQLKVALSCGIQVMVRSDLASSGVMFSIDTESGFRDAVLINASWGLGGMSGSLACRRLTKSSITLQRKLLILVA